MDMITMFILKQKIAKENLLLLLPEEQEDSYYLEKLLAWQEEYKERDITWEIFKEEYTECPYCNTYTDDRCICYAR